jgi:transposase-like protein
MLTKIKCPKCGSEGTFSLSDPIYDGPYKCWSCKEMFRVRIEDKVLKACEPMTADQLAKFQEIEALRSKFKHG